MEHDSAPGSRLLEWLDGRPLAGLARQLEVSRAHVSSIAKGKKRPSGMLAAKIERITGIEAGVWFREAA